MRQTYGFSIASRGITLCLFMDGMIPVRHINFPNQSAYHRAGKRMNRFIGLLFSLRLEGRT